MISVTWELESVCWWQQPCRWGVSKQGPALAFFLLFRYWSCKGWFKVLSYINSTGDSEGWMCISSWYDSLGSIPALWRMAGTGLAAQSCASPPCEHHPMGYAWLQAPSPTVFHHLPGKIYSTAQKAVTSPLPFLHQFHTSWLSVLAGVLTTTSWGTAAIISVKYLDMVFLCL